MDSMSRRHLELNVASGKLALALIQKAVFQRVQVRHSTGLHAEVKTSVGDW